MSTSLTIWTKRLVLTAIICGLLLVVTVTCQRLVRYGVVFVSMHSYPLLVAQ